MNPKHFEKQRVIKILGGQKKASEFFGIASQALSQWENGKPIPEKRRLQLMLALPKEFPVSV